MRQLFIEKSNFLAGGIIFMLLLISCTGSNKSNRSGHDKIHVLSSFSILTEMVDAIGGDRVKTHNLVPVGMAPHNYEPQPEDIKFASDADLFIYNGLNLEGGEDGWFMKLLHTVHADNTKIVKAAAHTEPMYLSGKNGSREVNPHAFINPRAGIQMAAVIRDALIAADPGNKDFYIESAAVYTKELEEIDREYQEKINALPEQNRVLFTSEQAFQYMTTQYGLKEGFIWAIDTDENGSPEQIKTAVAFIRKEKPPVLFVESNVDIRPMKTISKETRIPVYSPAIFSDELGKPGSEADTYLKYLRYNLKHIYNGLSRQPE